MHIYKERIKKYFETHKKEFISNLCDSIKIPSIYDTPTENMPFGIYTAAALGHFLELGNTFGLTTQNMDNYVGTIDMNSETTELHILAHLDVVPVENNWTITNPFEPKEIGNKLYGRGAMDDKGPAMAALYAMRVIKELGIPLKRNVRLILGTDEETDCRDIEYYYEREAEAPFTFSPDGSYPVVNTEKGGLYTTYSSGFSASTTEPLITSFKGGSAGNVVPSSSVMNIVGLCPSVCKQIASRLEKALNVSFSITEETNIITVHCHGKSSHAATPWEGSNANTGMLELIKKLPLAYSEGHEKLKAIAEIFPHNDFLGKAAGIAQQDEISGELTLCCNQIEYTPTSLWGKIDCRTPLCASRQSVLLPLKNKLNDSGIILPVDVKMNPPHHVSEESPFVRTLLGIYEDYTGKKGKGIALGGGTYVHHLKNGVAFGCMHPGSNYNIHDGDEYALIDELLMSGEMFAQVVLEICG